MKMKIQYLFKINLERVVFFFLAASAFGLGISYSKLYLFHLALFVLLGCLLVFVARKRFVVSLPFKKTKYHVWFYVFFAWYFLSLVWSLDLFFTVRYVAYIFMGSVISLTIIYYSGESLVKLDKVFKILTYVFCLEITICFLEALTPFRWPISPYSKYAVLFGKDQLDFASVSLSGLQNILASPTGFRWNPNNMAATLVIFLPFVLGAKKYSFKIVGSFFVLVALLMSGSRGALASIFVVFAAYLMKFAKIISIKKILIMSFIVLFSYLSSLLVLITDNPIKSGLVNLARSVQLYASLETRGKSSIGIRTQLMKNGWDALIESYGLGVGGGGSTRVQIIKGGAGVGEGGITNMHNFWMEVLVDAGVLFFLAFIVWYISLAYNLFKSSYDFSVLKYSQLNYYLFSSFVAMTGFMFAAISASTVIYLFPMWLLFGFSIATLNVARSLSDKK